MSKTKAALELGIEINALQEYLEDDVLPEHYETTEQYENAVAFVKWAKDTHKTNELLKLGLDREIENYLSQLAYDFTYELDEHNYIEIAEMLLNYYRQAWGWDNHPVGRFDVRKQAEILRERILLERGL